jgi:ferritin-like metal-binding protein YciE
MTNSKATHRTTKNPAAQSVSGMGNSELDLFFFDALKDIYWAEKHLLTALPKMQKKATTAELVRAIEKHVEQTEEHVNRLERVFELLDKKPQAQKCEAMEGLLKEGETILEETREGSMTRDVGIIIAAQKVEHYEIATYGSLVQLASIIGHDDIADILQKTLDEEKETDIRLTEIAESDINVAAVGENGKGM